MLKIDLKQGQTLWFTSDTHYGHSNICSAVTKWRDNKGNIPPNVRNFSSLNEMNEIIINNTNNYVKEDDILINIGDWSFGGFDNIQKFRDRIVCKNIYLITGNHDDHIINNRNNIQSIFTKVIEFYSQLEVKQNNISYKFVLCHFPIASWQDMAKGRIHIHGHVHLPPNQRMGNGKHLDVGLDGNNMKPYSMKEILALMNDKLVKPLILPNDHHEEKYTEIK